MSTEIARRFFEELCNQRRLDVADEILAPDHRYHDPQSPDLGRGPEAMKQTVALYQEALDGHWEVHEVVGCGDRVTVRWTGHGRQLREVMGIPATGREVKVDALTLLRIEDGKIAENWTTWDTLGMLQQLGAGGADVELLRGAYAAFARGDIARVVDALDDEIAWYAPDELPTGGQFDGVGAVLGFFDGLRRAYDELHVEPADFLEAGPGRVVVTGRHRGRLRGEPFEVGFAHVWTVRDGKATAFREYMDSGKLVPLFAASTAG